MQTTNQLNALQLRAVPFKFVLGGGGGGWGVGGTEANLKYGIGGGRWFR